MQISTLLPADYLTHVIVLFEEHGDPEVAQGQMKYMRYHFEFFGMKAPVWLPLTKDLFKKHGIYKGEQLKEFVRLCFADDHREVHYLAIEMVQKRVPKEPLDFIAFLDEMIVSRSWWDSVDWVIKLIGFHLQQYPELIDEKPWQWIRSENIWLVRTAILFQLKYKSQTDSTLLYKLILERADSKEFFIQKAAGWALREYSKTAAKEVEEFISKHELPPITKREGMKWLNKRKS